MKRKNMYLIEYHNVPLQIRQYLDRLGVLQNVLQKTKMNLIAAYDAETGELTCALSATVYTKHITCPLTIDIKTTSDTMLGVSLINFIKDTDNKLFGFY